MKQKLMTMVLAAGAMLEHTFYSGNYYGTPLSELERIEREGKIPLMILDIAGVRNIRKACAHLPLFAVYLYADEAEIRRRLQGRDKDLARIERRIKQNREDKEVMKSGAYRVFDAFVENRELSCCVAEVLSAYRSEISLTEEQKREALMRAFS